DQLRSGNQAGTGKAGSSDRDAERAEKFAPINCGGVVHGHLLRTFVMGWRARRISPPMGLLYHASLSRATCPKGVTLPPAGWAGTWGGMGRGIGRHAGSGWHRGNLPRPPGARRRG